MKLTARFSGIIAFILCMFCVSNVQAQDYVLAFSDRYSWRVDLLPAPCDDCRDIVRFDRNYVMYVLIEKMLYVLHPDGSGPAVFDLELAQRELDIPLEDMIPFEDGTVLFMTVPIIGTGLKSGKQLLLYETRSQSLRFLDKALANHLWDCGPRFPQPNYLRNPFIERVWPEKAIVLCLPTALNILNVETADLENHIAFPPRCEEICSHWQNLIGGHDGSLYLYNSRFPDIESPADYNLKQYNPETEKWSAHLVPPEIFDRAAAHGVLANFYSFTWPIAVDKHGNIYFQFSFMEDDVRKHDFVKTDSAGQVIWHFTEADLPDERLLFLDNDLFVAPDTGRLLQVMPIPASTSSR